MVRRGGAHVVVGRGELEELVRGGVQRTERLRTRRVELDRSAQLSGRARALARVERSAAAIEQRERFVVDSDVGLRQCLDHG